ncbi:MAG: DNA adenine methylase [Candidatus Babeliales bacterium]|jgi:hypothetical protein
MPIENRLQLWSYYGSKCKLIKYYPKPKYDTIIEPFAGSAWYSLQYPNHKIILCEKYKVIYDIWNWLINEATVDEILQYSNLYLGQDVSKLPIRKEHKYLLGFCINRGSSAPKNIVQKWSCQVKSKPNWASTTYFSLQRIIEYLPKIKHWKIILDDYQKLNNIEATWFIDPPYQQGGQHYIEHDLNYDNLANFCKTRRGQVIVCENLNAMWLPFKPLVEFHGQSHNNTEAIWTNE